MAKIRTYQLVENNLYVINFVNDLAALSKSDRDLVDKFGEPEINLGGSFTTDALEWELPNEYVKLVSGFPVRREFDLTASPFADEDGLAMLVTYRTTILSRIEDAFTALRANGDDFTDEFVTTI